MARCPIKTSQHGETNSHLPIPLATPSGSDITIENAFTLRNLAQERRSLVNEALHAMFLYDIYNPMALQRIKKIAEEIIDLRFIQSGRIEQVNEDAPRPDSFSLPDQSSNIILESGYDALRSAEQIPQITSQMGEVPPSTSEVPIKETQHV